MIPALLLIVFQIGIDADNLPVQKILSTTQVDSTKCQLEAELQNATFFKVDKRKLAVCFYFNPNNPERESKI